MDKNKSFVLATIAAVIFTACGGATDKNAANNAALANANAAKPAASAPTADALLALDKQANEAFIKGDSKFFEGMLNDKFVMVEAGQRMDKAAVVKIIAGNKCDVKTWNLDEPQLGKIDNDTYALSYKGTWDGTCTGPDGKAMKIPSPVRAATVFVRSGDKWQGAFHGENLIVDPKNLPPAKPDAKKEEPRKDDKTAANSTGSAVAAESTKATGDAVTEALVKVELALWEAWKAKDAKKLEDQTTKDISFVNIFGAYFATKADVMKDWTGTGCEVKSVSVTDGAGTMLSPTVGILTHKGAADGTCDGQKVGSVWGTSVYVKEGETWKLAFGFNSPAM